MGGEDGAGPALYASVPAHLRGTVTLSCALALVIRAGADSAAAPIALFAASLDVLLSRSLADEVRSRLFR